MNVDDYEKRTNEQGYWGKSTDYFYQTMEEQWRSEAYPGLEHPDWVYNDKSLLLNTLSQNKFDWTHYMEVPKFTLANIDSLYEAFKEVVISWINDMKQGTTNLAFLGGNGTGKTYSAIAACRFMALHGIIRGKDELYMPTVRMLECVDAHNILDNWASKQDALREVDRFKNIPLLIVDDLGAVATTAQAAIANIVSIVAHRYSLNLPTVVTANGDVETLNDIFGSTTIRRLVTENSIIHYS